MFVHFLGVTHLIKSTSVVKVIKVIQGYSRVDWTWDIGLNFEKETEREKEEEREWETRKDIQEKNERKVGREKEVLFVTFKLILSHPLLHYITPAHWLFRLLFLYLNNNLY